MPLNAGARLGPYEILGPAGAGGMGEVYRARDTRLDRTVAVKVLPAHLAEDPEFRQRFEREARAISTLSHPNICTLHDIGHQDGVDFLVMEYLEGETLAKRLAHGPLPVEQVLRHGIEIAGALAQAHRHGIIHRDLKPGNIMLTKTGAKLLDFGLAKMQQMATAAGQSVLPTRTEDVTVKGAVLGTFQYMAPEQLEGKDADARTDIFALGAVLYEMATGRKAFQGQSQASLITAIMSAEPAPLATLETLKERPQSAVLEHVIRKCLTKSADDRWQSAQDVAAEIEWIAGGGSQSMANRAAPRHTRREAVAWTFGGVASLAAAGLAAVHFRERPAEAHPMRFQIPVPLKMTFDFGDAPQLSPDGQHLVFPGAIEGRTLLWLRSLDSPSIRALAGTDGAGFPFWSPDSRFVGFFAGRKLKRMDVAGGVLQDLCETGDGFGGAWNREGLIVFSPGPGYPLHRISAGGGEPAVLIDLDGPGGNPESLPQFLPDGRAGAPPRQVGGRNSESLPQFLPDGRNFVYQTARGQTTGTYVASLDSKQTRLLVRGALGATYAPPGFLLFQLQGALLAQPFDARRLRLTGETTRLAASVSVFSVSDNGLLAYRSAASSAVQLAWYSRDGKRLVPVGEPGVYTQIALSLDERRLAVERGGSGSQANLWLLELASGIFSRLTFKDGNDPVWSPDSRQLVFSSSRTGVFDLYRKVIGGGEEDLLFKSGEPKYSEEWSRDGSFVIFINENGKAFYRLPLEGERKPELLLRTEFDKDEPHLSPDGRWIAYGSDESGRWEVYVAAFPSFAGKRQVSNAGGGRAAWRRDGKELFYLSLDGKLVAVDVKAGSTLETGAPHALFQTPIRVDPRLDQYCVSGDGQRFLLGEPVGESAESITVVLNWAAGLKR